MMREKKGDNIGECESKKEKGESEGEKKERKGNGGKRVGTKVDVREEREEERIVWTQKE